MATVKLAEWKAILKRLEEVQERDELELWSAQCIREP